VVWLSKTWISEKIKGQIKGEYDARLERLKAELKAQADVEVEKLKAQLKSQSDSEVERLKSHLSIAAAERQFRFSRLHEKRLDVIADVHASLRRLVAAIAGYVAIFEPAGGPPRQERAKRAFDEAKGFGELYDAKRIFLPRSAVEKLDQIQSELRVAYNTFALGVDVAHDGDPNRTKRWLEIFEKIERLTKTGISELEDDYRRLLGDETP